MSAITVHPEVERLFDTFHSSLPAGTTTKRVQLEVKLQNTVVMFEDDVPFAHWLVAQHHRLRLAPEKYKVYLQTSTLSAKGLTPAHYGVLVGMSPDELEAMCDQSPWPMAAAPRPGVPTALQLALALGRPDLAKCLVSYTARISNPRLSSRCELEALYPLSDESAYVMTLRRIRGEPGRDAKRAYNAVATEIEAMRRSDFNKDLHAALDAAHSRRHDVLSLAPYALVFFLLLFTEALFFRHPVHVEVLNAKQAAINDCNGRQFACAKAVNTGVALPLKMCGNRTLKRPCLSQTYVTHTALSTTVDPFEHGQSGSAQERRAGSWEHRTYDLQTDSAWACRFDTVVTQRSRGPWSERFEHTVTCSGPEWFTVALLILISAGAVGIGASLFRDLRSWRRGHLCPSWSDWIYFWVGVATDVVLCAAVGVFVFALWPRGEKPDVGALALGRMATPAAMLCISKCLDLLPANESILQFLVSSCAMALVNYSSLLLMYRNPMTVRFFAFDITRAVLLSIARGLKGFIHARRLAYLEEIECARKPEKGERIARADPLVRGTTTIIAVYCALAWCLVCMAWATSLVWPNPLELNLSLANPTCEWGSGCVISTP